MFLHPISGEAKVLLGARITSLNRPAICFNEAFDSGGIQSTYPDVNESK
jgi:hypothetical protein